MNLEHPDITAAQAFGYPRKPREVPERPVCGRECSDFYVVNGEIVGCDRCASRHDAMEFLEEFM